jgi:hypothetical protein
MTPISTDDTASPGTATNAPRATVERTLGDDLLRGADAIASSCSATAGGDARSTT